MESREYLSYLVHEIHTTVVATVDDAGLPVTAAIDMMDADENGVYFLTAKGKGFYDRLLKKISAPFTGVAYDCQIVAEIPSLPHDVAMSWVVTPNHLYQHSRDTRKSLRICTNRK